MLRKGRAIPSIGKALRRLRSLREAIPRVWFLAEHGVGQKLESLPPPTDFPGLILYHEIDSGNGAQRLFSYWETEGDFDANRSDLERRLGATRLTRHGFLRRLALKKQPFWGKPYTVLLHVVAILGALSALEKHYAWLFETPAVVLEMPGDDPLNLPENRRLRADLIIKNARASVETEARISAANLMTPDGQTAQELNVQQGPHSILAGEVLGLPMVGGRLPRGVYKLDVQVAARAGLLREEKVFSLEREVRFWSNKPQCRFLTWGTSGKRNLLKGVMHVGQDYPGGLTCLATLEREGAMKFEYLDFPDVTDWDEEHDGAPGQEVARLRWLTGNLQKFSEIRFGVYLGGSPRVDWADVLKGAKIACDRPLESEARR